MEKTLIRTSLCIGSAVVTLLLLLLAGCSEEQKTEPDSLVRPVRYVTLEAGDQSKSRTFSGTAVSARQSSLSFKVAGTIQNIPVKIGDVVDKGTLLAELDETDLKVEVESAEANLRSVEADAQASLTAVNTTRSNYARIEKLYESDNVSLSEFEKARGDFETAQAQRKAANSQVATARTKLQAAKNQLSYTKLTAPFAGIINSIEVDENEEVAPGSAIMIISGFDKLEVKVNLSDLYISNIRRNMPCVVTFPSLPDIRVDGLVSEVPFAASDVPTYPVTISIEAADERLRPGMSANVTFNFSSSGEGNSIYLPVDAVGEDNEGNFVFILEATEKNIYLAKKRKVTLGPLSETGFEVEAGVSAGEKIATSGLQILLDGMQVTLLDKK
ncbi:MAG: efflux RND transporter periplasmic adaptor subunit [Desulfopila sp.]|jgi:RND family efflux transporter MFP subunit|nr:efflux RND transporter periplasmic adaptor subunit [Desulfopila sp.]